MKPTEPSFSNGQKMAALSLTALQIQDISCTSMQFEVQYSFWLVRVGQLKFEFTAKFRRFHFFLSTLPFPPVEVVVALTYDFIVTMDSAETYPLAAFDTLLSRNVPHILENIFFSMDYNSFKTCMKVNKTWRELLTTAPYQKILEKLLTEKT